MIHWLTQSCCDVPHHFGWLSSAELEHCSALKTQKRRYDWLMGRWTAKQLVRSVVHEQSGDLVPLPSISVLTRTDGSPLVTIEGKPRFSLSISHSHDRAFCALADCGRLGADIEAVEARIPAFADDYFAAPEQLLLERAPERDLLVTAIWSAKESVLKALRLGLTVDTRTVLCLIEPGRPADWRRFTVEAGEAQFSGWWRVMDGFVLSLVSEGQSPESQLRRILS